MKWLQVGERFKLQVEHAEDVIAIVGRRGRGKTSTAVVLVEELHRAGRRFCVADPVGVWHGIKSSRDGRSPGIPAIVMGGDHGDVPLEATAGAVIADFVAGSESSVILDFLAPGDQASPWSALRAGPGLSARSVSYRRSRGRVSDAEQSPGLLRQAVKEVAGEQLEVVFRAGLPGW